MLVNRRATIKFLGVTFYLGVQSFQQKLEQYPNPLFKNPLQSVSAFCYFITVAFSADEFTSFTCRIWQGHHPVRNLILLSTSLYSNLPQFHTSSLQIRSNKMGNLSLSDPQEDFLYSYIFTQLLRKIWRIHHTWLCKTKSNIVTFLLERLWTMP